ncbi:hydrolase [Salmonella enterica]
MRGIVLFPIINCSGAMVEITSTEMTPPVNDSHEFIPMRGIRNRHLQTMLPRLIRRKVKFNAHWQRLELPDGDFVDLAWSEDPQQAKYKPRLVVFHGLEGSLNSPYAHGLIEAAQKRGWLGVVMHFRGCSGEPNRLNRIYHSGETEDGAWFLRWLQREFGAVPTAAVGYSLGGNMLACLLAKEGRDIPIEAAVIVSAPFVLEACSYHMDKGFSRVYQRYLLNLLNLQSKCNKKRSTHQLEYNFVSTQKPFPNDEYFLPTSYNKRARKDNDFTRTGQKTSRNCQSTGT